MLIVNILIEVKIQLVMLLFLVCMYCLERSVGWMALGLKMSADLGLPSEVGQYPM